MNKQWLLPAALVILAGCGVDGPAPTANKCKDCGPEKCYRTVMVPVTEEVTYNEFKAVDKDCVVETKKPTTKKVPVKTYRYIEEWVDVPVQEAYTEKVPVRKETKVPVNEKYLSYDPVTKKVPGTFECSKTITNAEWKCDHKQNSVSIKQCGVCGQESSIKATREYSVPVKECKTTVETAKCPAMVNKVVDEPSIKDRTVVREGYYTEMEDVTKYRTVPGKKLVRKRICETVMVDVPDTEVETKTVKRTLAEPVEKTKKVTRMVEKKVEIDCQTGAEITKKEEVKEEAKQVDIAALARQAESAPAAASAK